VDAGLITAIVGALAVLGTGAKYVIDRMDRKREKRETAVEELLKAQAAKAERRYARLHATATKWREQLIVNNIDPRPADWPEDTNE
jgi:hypothetical protein